MQLIEENYEFKYRIDLMWHEYNALVEIIEIAKNKDIYINSNLLKKIENYKPIKVSSAKLNAATKASETRSKKVIEKFNKAVAELKNENIELTPYKIAKTANISFATAKKYLKLLNES